MRPVMLLAFAMLISIRPASALDVDVRDARTGAPLAAELALADGGGAGSGSTWLATDGRVALEDACRNGCRITAKSAAHHPLSTRLTGAETRVTLLLEPLDEPARYRRLDERAAARPGSRWVQGYVRRADDGTPVAGARVEVGGSTTYSEADGHFEAGLPAAAEDADQAAQATIEVSAAGYPGWRREGLLAAPGVTRVVIALGDGVPSAGAFTVGARDRREAAVEGEHDAPARISRTLAPPHAAAVAPPLAPPSSIRVGYLDAACTQPCCTGDCSHTCTMPLETYVRRGLDSEWIASWRAHSLRAGSIAYRSYGAWRVANPIRPAFDICSSACCQVNDATTSSSTDDAVARTPGILLTRDGTSAASSEYSAENNSWDDPADGLSCSNVDLSCGDGNAGSPGANWPCLADPVGAGHGCFGHGRGMSQWGTQRWAGSTFGSRDWRWIVDHYYNDNDDATGAGSGLRTAFMTSPLELASPSAMPATAALGDTVTMIAAATNMAGADHPHLLIGASLYRSGSGYIDDPSHDAPLALDTGTHAIARAFTLPPSAQAGMYDVLLSLYLDVDGDGAISAPDLPLALVSADDALRVVDDRIFADGFDPP